MARSYYVNQKTLLIVPRPRGEEIRVTLGERANGDQYVDVRTWYENDEGEMRPGKGIATKDINSLWDEIAKAILERADRKNQEAKVYDPKGLK